MKKKTDYSKIPESETIVKDIYHRYKIKKLGSTVYIIGLSGTGKSSASQRLAELITEKRIQKNDTEPKTYIVDSLITFLDALMECKLGDIIVIEEISVLFPSRRAMAGDNLAIAKVLDTVRKKQLCLIANAPIWNSIDGHMRAMGNILIETLKIKRGEGIVISKCHRLQTNPGSGKTYTHTYQRGGKDAKLIYTRMPNTARWDEYESQKDDFMKKLYQNLKNKAEAKEKKENKMFERAKPSIRDLTAREFEVQNLWGAKGMKQKDIAKELGLTESRISYIIKNIKKKSLNTRENEDIGNEKLEKKPLN